MPVANLRILATPQDPVSKLEGAWGVLQREVLILLPAQEARALHMRRRSLQRAPWDFMQTVHRNRIQIEDRVAQKFEQARCARESLCLLHVLP